MSQALPLLLLGGSVGQAYGQYQQGKAADQAAQANAGIMEQEATIARQQGGAREEAQRRRAREFLGTQRAAIGQAGIGWQGSAADVIEESATNAELDALNIRYESELQARGLLNQAALTRWEGKQAKRAGKIAAVGSLLTGAAMYGSGGFGGKAGGSAAGGTGVKAGSSTGFKATGGQGLRY